MLSDLRRGTTLASDTAGAGGPLKDDTVRVYLTALERLMIVEDQPAWAPRMRSRTRCTQPPNATSEIHHLRWSHLTRPPTGS